MTVETRVESPLHSRAAALRAQAVTGMVEIDEVPARAQVDLRADPKSTAAERIGTALGTGLPHQPGDVSRAGDLTTVWLGPDEWLVLGPEGAARRITNAAEDAAADEHVSVVDVSANRAIIGIAGTHARELLNKGCSLDLHPRVFPSNRCARTMLGRADIVLLCWDAEWPLFWVMVRSSSARYLADWLLDAVAEYGR